jgi:2-polyprenyl-3-methyl-5-hydroxy-6-metoxy-1,4-benzoquinol methylase
MVSARGILRRVVYGKRLNLIPPTQRPYAVPLMRRYHEWRHARLLRRRPIVPIEEYRSSVSCGEIEEFIGCTLCGDTRQQPLYQPAGRQESRRWSYRVVRCPGCGFLYRNPNIIPERLGDLYADSYSSFLSGTYAEKRVRRYRLTMQAFHPVFDDGEGRRLLDFGCGVGLFLSEAEQRGFVPYGVDLSPDSIEQARTRVPNAGTYLGAPADVPEIAAGDFDVITMWSVLAHLPRPIDDLSGLRSLLTADGVLLILTVNANSLLLKAAGSRWNGFTANHLMFYSPQTLPLLLARAGFAAVATAPFYGDTVEAGTTKLSADRVARLRKAVDESQGGNMMRAVAFASDAAVQQWGTGMDVRRLDEPPLTAARSTAAPRTVS